MKMDLLVAYYFDLYKNFMCISKNDFPLIITNLYNDEKDPDNQECLLYVKDQELKSAFLTLYVNDKFNDLNDTTYKKSKLFHEFTHIYDANISLSKYIGEDYSMLMSTFSEFHASQIELAVNMGFQNIHDFHKIDTSDIIITSENGKTSIQSDYLNPFASFTNIINKDRKSFFDLNAYDYCKIYKNFKTKIMYYLGKKSFCDQYSINSYKDITKEYTKEFYKIIDFFKISLINQSYEHVLQANNIMWNFYKSYFISSVENELPKIF